MAVEYDVHGVFICDICGKKEELDEYDIDTIFDAYEDLPFGWKEIGSEIVCEVCVQQNTYHFGFVRLEQGLLCVHASNIRNEVEEALKEYLQNKGNKPFCISSKHVADDERIQLVIDREVYQAPLEGAIWQKISDGKNVMEAKTV